MENFEKKTFVDECDPIGDGSRKKKEVAIEFDRLADQISWLREKIKKLTEDLEPALAIRDLKAEEEEPSAKPELCRIGKRVREFSFSVNQANVALDDIMDRLEI